jgi:hypothetical protein
MSDHASLLDLALFLLPPPSSPSPSCLPYRHV